MVASAVPGQPQYAPRLLAVHPLCPMALQHRDAWKLQHYRTIESWASIAGAEYRNAVCNVCDSAVQLLIFNIADLESQIKTEGGKLTERKAVQTVVQPCLTALADLHAIGMSHGAVAPYSIVYSNDDATCKLAGLFMPPDLSNAEQVTALQHYAAPEQTDISMDALCQSASAASDVFALGMLTYSMIVGKDAFPAKNDGLSRRWQEPDVPLWVSDSAQDFLSKSLVKDPAKRSKASDLVKHPWLKSLGLKAPASQIPSSVAVVTPVLQPRVVIPEPEPVLEISHLTVTDEPVVEEEIVEASPIEIAVSASAAAATPASPSSKNGRKAPAKPAATHPEGGWDLFYKTGPSKPKSRKNSMVVPKVVKDTETSPKAKRNSLMVPSKQEEQT